MSVFSASSFLESFLKTFFAWVLMKIENSFLNHIEKFYGSLR